MAAGYGTKSVAITVVAVLAVAGLGYWGYGAYKQRELRGAVAAVVKDAAGRLRDALNMEAAATPEDRPGNVAKLEGHAAAMDKAIAQVKRLPVERNRALTDDADGYLITVREIFRKEANMNRYHYAHGESVRALRDHMRADDRTSGWVSGAVRIKERAERDYRDYRLAVAAYSTLLGQLANAQSKVAAVAGKENLIAPEQVTQAREKVVATAKAAESEMEKARALVGPR
jgi:hypothetical protein